MVIVLIFASVAEKPSKLVESRDTNITDKDAIMAGHPVEGVVVVEEETVEMEAIVRNMYIYL